MPLTFLQLYKLNQQVGWLLINNPRWAEYLEELFPSNSEAFSIVVRVICYTLGCSISAFSCCERLRKQFCIKLTNFGVWQRESSNEHPPSPPLTLSMKSQYKCDQDLSLHKTWMVTSKLKLMSVFNRDSKLLAVVWAKLESHEIQIAYLVSLMHYFPQNTTPILSLINFHDAETWKLKD